MRGPGSSEQHKTENDETGAPSIHIQGALIFWYDPHPAALMLTMPTEINYNEICRIGNPSSTLCSGHVRSIVTRQSRRGVSVVPAKAFILVEAAVGKNREVVTALKRIKGVKTVDSVTGPYDVIAVVEGENLNEIGDLVTARIQLVPDISRTVTCLAIG